MSTQTAGPLESNTVSVVSCAPLASPHSVLIQRYYVLLTRGCHRFQTSPQPTPFDQPHTDHAPLCALYLRRYKKYKGEIQLPEVSRLALVLSTTGKDYLTCGSDSLWTPHDDKAFPDHDWACPALPSSFRHGWNHFSDHQLRAIISRFVHQVQLPLIPYSVTTHHWSQAFASLNHLVHFLIPHFLATTNQCSGLDLNHLHSIEVLISHNYDTAVTAWTEFLSHFTIGLQSLHSGIIPVLLSFFLIWTSNTPHVTIPTTSIATTTAVTKVDSDYPISSTSSSENIPSSDFQSSRLPTILVVQICNLIHRLPPSLHPELARWILTYPLSISEEAPRMDRDHGAHVLHRVVTTIHETISASYSPASRSFPDNADDETDDDRGAVSDQGAIHAIKALKVFDIINRKYSLLPTSSFYHPDINVHFSPKAEYLRWKSSSSTSPNEKSDAPTPLALAQYPFILNSASKADLLRIESMVHQRHHLQATFFRAMFVGVHSPFLDIVVRRSHAVRDTLVQLGSVTELRDLRKQLRVQFVGEPGVDEGGVARELLALVMRGLIDPVYGMFYASGSVIWFSPDATVFGFVAPVPGTGDDISMLDDGAGSEADPRIEEEYELVGKLVGIALYNSIVLQVHFPTALFKKLLGHPLTGDDLEEIDPMLASGMRTLATFPAADVAETYCRTFAVEEQVGPGEGKRVIVDLIPNGNEVELTGDNRKEYISKILDYHLNVRVSKSFQAFRRGFDAVTKESSIRQLFNPDELAQVVLGEEELDLDALQGQTLYDGGYTKESPLVKYLWDVLRSLSSADLRRFLYFVTGTDRAPAGGLGRVTLVVMRQGPDSDRLPSAHTCFNVVLIPEYTSQPKLEERLRKALENLEGFGLI